jgi:diguanylate cyclase
MSRLSATAQRAVVADEDLGRLLLSEAVSQLGLITDAVGDGAAALRAAQQPNVGLVLLDVDMPNMNGYDVCRRLRNIPQLDTVPIIIVTGHEDRDAIEQAFQAGATDFISKPVNWVLLPHRLSYVMRNATATRNLADREAKVNALLKAVPDALWLFSSAGELRWNPTTHGNQGGPTDTTGTQPTLIAPPECMPDVLTAIQETARTGDAGDMAYKQLEESGETKYFELRFSRHGSDDVLVVRQDATERMQAAERMRRLAYFDTLTDLPNRQQLLDSAESWVRAAKGNDAVAAIYLDLNNFKRINDSFGHAVGDAVLKSVAGKLRTALKSFAAPEQSILLTRFGGDEFVILVGGRDTRALAARVAQRCLDVLCEPVTHGRMELFTGPSVGLAVFPDHAKDVDTLLKHADTAMYHAKSTGANSFTTYTPALSGRVRDWLELESRLRRAVRDETLYLHFQPKFRLSDNKLVGVEALARWCDEEHGNIPPSQFIAMAEESGLIMDIGAWVARAACRQARRWMDRGIEMPIAINVSGKELLHSDPVAIIEAAIAAEKIPPRLLEIEITESVVVRESSAVREGLERLRSLGCKIALDDFGTGYSSLAYVARFPLDGIKIDRAFVREVDHSPGNAAIANAILSLAHSLGLEVTAEGVEDRAQLEWLRARGCDQVQGFLLSRPIPAAELEARFLTLLSGSDDVNALNSGRT